MPFPTTGSGYKADDALNALFSGYDAGAAEVEQRNQMMASSIDNVKRFLDSQKLAQEMPYDLQTKQLAGAQAQQQMTPEMLKAFASGKAGEYGQQEAAGRLAQGTVESDILAKVGSNKEKVAQFGKEQQFRDLDYWTAANGNPEVALQLGMSPESVSKFQAMKDPRMLNRFRTDQALKEAGHLQKVDLEDVKGYWDQLKQKLANEGAIGAANVAGNKQLAVIRGQTMSQINAFERELQDYEVQLAKMKSPFGPIGIRITESPEYRSAKDKQAYMKQAIDAAIQEDPMYKRAASLRKEITSLRTQANEIANVIQGKQIETKQPENKADPLGLR